MIAWLTMLHLGTMRPASALPIDVRSCVEFVTLRRRTPLVGPTEAARRRIAADLTRLIAALRADRAYRPPHSAYHDKLSDFDLLTDPRYFWYFANAWHEAYAELFPDLVTEAQALHGDRIIPVPRAIPGLAPVTVHAVLAEFFPSVAAPPSPARDEAPDTSDLGHAAWWDRFGRALGNRD